MADNGKKTGVMPMGGRGNIGGGEKAKNFGAAISKLVSYCRRSLPILVIAVILAIIGSIFNVIGPDYLSEMTNIIVEGIRTGIDVSAFTSVALFLAGLYGLGFLFNVIQGVMMSNLAQRTTKRLRRDLLAKVNRLPLKYFDGTTVGDTLSRITNDVDTIGQSLTQSLSSLVTSVTMFVGALVMMFHTNWLMALAGVAKQEFNEMNKALYNSAWKSQFMSGLMMPLMGFVGNLGYVVVCVVGAVLVMNGSISFGVIVAFMVYIRLFTQPLSQIAQVITSLQSAAAASERAFALLEEEELSDEEGKIENFQVERGDIEFTNVRFGYQPDKEIIHNFSASAKGGQKIAIVGPTGAGKTTMVNLLMRFYELNGGSISIDGKQMDGLTRENVHQLFGMVLQDTWLFEGTIRENIIYNKEGVTEEQLIEVCRATGLYHFIKTLPKGLDTVLDDNASLSAGQKQLVTIARAMAENAPLLILDEATSSVDTRTEVLIQKAMDRLMAGRTSFVIAHRLSTIRNADLILVMKDGDIIENGTHDELMSKSGFYMDLYNSQFDKAS
ncbi:ATP-binding cassette subfamily B multidrug efflux pump [Aequitasia blattaphilus]|uniref:ABC transporter ATP-binding protein/permease n=1 Tax=Aequitasia blattaphilus TaxID=2949332 RepID=A0ABT1EBI9_9FIRM|nr:ABC transporter ATP-binding protein [Aequitasia blattaphilus]MCP1103182.1 ABC transporter ATP-binding protein/permease [Aequitasia blattaphilus]MCR8615822.1 ABC transporter ATP-binding protein/permease [Aequitasia blattaphilus]